MVILNYFTHITNGYAESQEGRNSIKKLITKINQIKVNMASCYKSLKY